MDTTSGRIYLPDEYAKRKARAFTDEHQAEFEARLAEEKIVEVSDRVAELMLGAQAAAARKAARRAAKQARKRNR